MTRRATSDWRVMDASTGKIMTYFAADAWSTMTCYTGTGISASARRKFPFGGSIAKAINKVHDFFDDIRVSMHISAGTKVDINKPIKDMNKVERLFCRVNLRQEIKTIQMEEMTDIRGKLNRAYSPVKEREAAWVDECRKERERLKGVIDENIKKSTPIIEKDKTKTKERPSRDM